MKEIAPLWPSHRGPQPPQPRGSLSCAAVAPACYLLSRKGGSHKGCCGVVHKRQRTCAYLTGGPCAHGVTRACRAPRCSTRASWCRRRLPCCCRCRGQTSTARSRRCWTSASRWEGGRTPGGGCGMCLREHPARCVGPPIQFSCLLRDPSGGGSQSTHAPGCLQVGRRAAQRKRAAWHTESHVPDERALPCAALPQDRVLYLRLHPLMAGVPMEDLQAASEVLGLAFFPPGAARTHPRCLVNIRTCGMHSLHALQRMPMQHACTRAHGHRKAQEGSAQSSTSQGCVSVRSGLPLPSLPPRRQAVGHAAGRFDCRPSVLRPPTCSRASQPLDACNAFILDGVC